LDFTCQEKDPDKCLTVTLDDESYKQVIFEVEDKESATLEIEEAKRQLK
jgi:hypothetical protein